MTTINSASTNPPPSAQKATNTTTWSKTYNSFSGCDMIATFGGVVIGELQGISFTVQREKAPVYTMGEADPRSFSRGKRGIAGSLVFVVFDRSALLEIMRDRPYIANASIAEEFVVRELTSPQFSADLHRSVGMLGTFAGAANKKVSQISLDKVIARPQYLDQVYPFDIVITASNEYGAFASMEIHGVEILNQGSSMSIDDITTDEACTFIATRIIPWKDQGFTQINEDNSVTYTR